MQLVEPNALNQRPVEVLQLVSGAEEMVEPEHPSWSQHSVDVEHQEMEQRGRNPVAEDVHGVHDVQSVVEERQPLRYAHVQRHHPSRRYEIAEWPVQVHRCRHYRYVPLHHSHRECRRSATDVEPDSDSTYGDRS